jgi:hypothetical protein
LNVQADILLGGGEQFRDFQLSQPNGVAFQPELDFGAAVIGVIKDKCSCGDLLEQVEDFGFEEFYRHWRIRRQSSMRRDNIHKP